MSLEKTTSRKIIKSRFAMMGEGVIPKKELEGITDVQLKIFLTEPNPDKWPPELSHLKKYVPEDTAA
ncbi:MAG: hypothetical protein JRK53_12675 [Deltaproteobacteria bacterium]|nr:hypothetical protein [Deltaproteobacteria bacterium]